jgi:L-lactate dehydrogenase complex protein LldG
MTDPNHVLEKVRHALGRSAPLASAPVPPVLSEPIIRLVHTEIGLGELFARRAGENAMDVEGVSVEELPKRLIDCLNAASVHRIALPVSPFLRQLEVQRHLNLAGFEVGRWDQLSADELYDFDCGVTDVYCAVAETGSLVIRPSAGQGRTLSLVPPLHVAILQPKDFVPDLVDLFEKLQRDGTGSGITLISGPSKTSDIEMTLVTGVHGPMRVKVFILQ